MAHRRLASTVPQQVLGTSSSLQARPLTPDNVDAAIDILAQNYPGQLADIVKTLQADALGAEGLRYFVHYDAKGNPAGVSGAHIGRNPQRGYTGLSYMYRTPEMALHLGQFIERKYNIPENDHDTPQENARPASRESNLRKELKVAETTYLEQQAIIRANQNNFFAKHGDLKTYLADERLVDLSELLVKQIKCPWLEALEKLNDDNFPLETEREIVYGDIGLNLYTQPDKTGKYAPSQRKVLAILNEDKTEVIAAIVYGVAAFPEELRPNKEGLDATLGITYLMTHKDHRKHGFGTRLVQEALKQSKEFLRQEMGIEDAQIAHFTEQNAADLLNSEEYITDCRGALLGPINRAGFWGGIGQRCLDAFRYVQVSLRPGLDPCDVLKLHIAMPGKSDGFASISPKLLKYAIKAYADLCLNKQQRNIDEDPDYVEMEKVLNAREESYFLKPRLQKDEVVPGENLLRAAVVQLGIKDPETALGDVVPKYKAAIQQFKNAAKKSLSRKLHHHDRRM